MANLRNADARNGNRSMPKTIIDGIECSPRMIRYVTNKGKIFETLKNQIGNGTFRIKNLKSFLTEDGPKVRTVQAPSVIERIGSNAIMEPLENRLSSLLIELPLLPYKDVARTGCFIRYKLQWQKILISNITIKATTKDIMTVLITKL